jgi:hypothetical protein
MAQPKDHPDPNLLSAFIEKSLGKGARALVIEHLSACTSCREVVSLSAVLPETSSGVSVAPASLGWLSWPALRWAAAGACVVVVGAAVTLHQRGSQPGMVNRRPVAESKLAVQNGVTENITENNGVTSQTSSEGSPTTAGRPVEMADARPALAGVVPGKAKDAIAEQPGDQSEKSMNVLSAGKMAFARKSASNEANPASLSPRWTLSSDGTLQRSLDSGRTWRKIPVPAQTTLRALAANGLDIWVGGSGGALFHSSDAGRRWTRVRPVVNGEALTADIIGVEFPDLLHGKLTIADADAQALNRSWQPGQILQQYDFPADSRGEDVAVQKTPGPAFSGKQTWSTADAGQTWEKQ